MKSNKISAKKLREREFSEKSTGLKYDFSIWDSKRISYKQYKKLDGEELIRINNLIKKHRKINGIMSDIHHVITSYEWFEPGFKTSSVFGISAKCLGYTTDEYSQIIDERMEVSDLLFEKENENLALDLDLDLEQIIRESMIGNTFNFWLEHNIERELRKRIKLISENKDRFREEYYIDKDLDEGLNVHQIIDEILRDIVNKMTLFD